MRSIHQDKAKRLLLGAGHTGVVRNKATANAIAGSSQSGRVLHAMLDENWHTLYEIHSLSLDRTGVMDSESAISARIRDLRNIHGLTIISRARRPSHAHEYKLVATSKSNPELIMARCG